MLSQPYRILSLLSLTAVLVSACLSPTLPTRTPSPLTPTVTARPSATPPPTATVRPSPTPTAPTLALPAEFADGRSAAVAQAQRAQSALKIERVADSATALARLLTAQAHWAIIAGAQPSATARLLCLTPYVAIVHYTSPLDDVSAERVRAIFQGKDWAGSVFYSGDISVQRRVLGLSSFAANVSALPTWKAVIDRVAGDRTAFAFVPWSEVDARVKALAIDGRSIAANGVQGYAIGDAWWLGATSGAPAAIGNDLAARFACSASEPVTFVAGGDMLMGWFVNDLYIKKEGPEYPFRRIRDLFRSADISFGNFENPMSPGASEGYLRFRAPPEAVRGLTFAGIDVVNLANNHMGDYGSQALLHPSATLRQNGIA